MGRCKTLVLWCQNDMVTEEEKEIKTDNNFNTWIGRNACGSVTAFLFLFGIHHDTEELNSIPSVQEAILRKCCDLCTAHSVPEHRWPFRKTTIVLSWEAYYTFVFEFEKKTLPRTERNRKIKKKCFAWCVKYLRPIYWHIKYPHRAWLTRKIIK